MSSERSFRFFSCVLYPDDPKYPEQIRMLNEYFIYVAILHDRDWDDNGDLKKPHVHVVLSLPNTSPTSVKSVCDKLSLKYAEGVRSVRGSMRYLCHADDPDKFQYLRTELSGSPYMVAKAKRYLSEDMNGSILDLLSLLDSIDEPLDYYDFLTIACDAHMFSAFRSIKIDLVLQKHNEKYRSYKESENKNV